MSYEVVFHIDWDDELVLNMALMNMENLFKMKDSSNSKVHLVANGESVRLFRKEFCEKHMARIRTLHGYGARFCVCNYSLNKLNYSMDEVIDVCEVVSGGVAELCRLQASGCAYIKP